MLALCNPTHADDETVVMDGAPGNYGHFLQTKIVLIVVDE